MIPPVGKHTFEEPGISVVDLREPGEELHTGDRRDGKFYRYTPDIKLAVRVALAIGRPLLIYGPSGCGKSSLAYNIARILQWRFYEFVVSSKSEAKDLYYRFDAVRRLGESQMRSADIADNQEWRTYYPFIEPGPLWWVFDPATARQRGSSKPLATPAVDPGWWPNGKNLLTASNDAIPPAVLLVDEIDKADPDFPNNLLVPLGSRQFLVEETGDLVTLRKAHDESKPLVVITSNRERELPPAFVRRCVVLHISVLDADGLIDLAKSVFQTTDEARIATWRRLSDLLQEIRGPDQVSPAEYLDTIKAVESLGADEGQWKDILLRTAWSGEADDEQQ